MTIFVIVGIMTEAHSFRSKVGIGSESVGLLEFRFFGYGGYKLLCQVAASTTDY